MRWIQRMVALSCLATIIVGCSGSISPASVTTLTPEDVSSTVMSPNNYQAVTQAIAQRQDITPFLKQQPSLAKKTYGGKTLLFDAAFFGNKDAAKALLDNGAEVNYTTGVGMTALDSAVSSKSENVIALLQQHEAVIGKGP